MKKRIKDHNSIVLFLLGLIAAGLFLIAIGNCNLVYADPLPELSDRKFEQALIEMAAEYDKDVTQKQASKEPYLSERLIVKSMDSDLDPDDYGAVDAIQDREGTYVLQFDSIRDAKAAAADLKKEDSTVYVEPDAYLFACSFSPVIDSSLWGKSAQVIGADRFAEALADSSGVVRIAVLDTGISYTSPKLTGRLDTSLAKSFLDDFSDADQSHETSGTKLTHGTHVAGIITQCTESLTNIRIIPVRVLNNDGGGRITTVSNAIRYAADNGADVINLSLCGETGSVSQTMRAAINYAISKGSVVITVAGNDGKNLSTYTPSNIPESIVVGAVNGNSSSYPRYSNGNYGTTLDVVAPGVNVYSTAWNGSENGYNTLTGTSMAAPHAAAAAAMIKLAHNDYSAAAIEHLIQKCVIDLGTQGKDDYYGFGMIDLSLLLDKEKEEELEEELNDWEQQNQAAADAVIEMIAALPVPVTLNDKTDVQAARAAYDALTYVQKQLVTNYDILTEAEARLSDLEAAQAVIYLIDALPETIILENRSQVEEARAAYDALTQDQKALVANLEVLENAETVIRDLEAADEVMQKISSLPDPITLAYKDQVEEARAAYDALTQDQRDLVTNLEVLENAETIIRDLEAADEVMQKISSLPDSITLAYKDQVEEARAAYDVLTQDQKALVTNLEILENAETVIRNLDAQAAQAAQAVMDLITALPEAITLDNRSQVEEARTAYDNLTQSQQKLVTNYSTLTGAEVRITDLEAAQTVMDLITALPETITLNDRSQVEEARTAYDALTQDQKDLVTNLDALESAETAIRNLDAQAVQTVIDLIAALPETITLENRSQVEEARAAYDALAENQKDLVTNLKRLENAETEIKNLDAQAAQTVIDMINSLPDEITIDDKEALDAVFVAYNALTKDQKKLVTNLENLVTAEAKLLAAIDAALQEEETEKTEKPPEKGARYTGSNPRPNVTYRVPLKKKQKTKKLKVTGLAGGDRIVSWKSSNRKKVKVTGKPDGTCVIQAGTKAGKVKVTAVCASGKKVVFLLKVQNQKVRTKKLKIKKKTITITAGETLKLNTTLQPVTSVEKKTYSVKNKKIAAVSKKGVIKGRSPGTTVVTVKSGRAKIRIKVIVSE